MGAAACRAATAPHLGKYAAQRVRLLAAEVRLQGPAEQLAQQGRKAALADARVHRQLVQHLQDGSTGAG